MLKCEIDINEKKILMSVNLCGDLSTICADLTLLLNRMYLDLKSNKSEIGEAFREMMTKIVTDPTSPVWMEDNGDAEV